MAMRSNLLTSLVIVVAACGAPTGPAPTGPAAGATPGVRVVGDDVGATGPDSAPAGEPAAILTAHNRYRAAHCVPPLAWSAELAAVAQRWANHLRDAGCAFEHSGDKYGENLAAGTTGYLGAESSVDMWYREIELYDFARGGFSMQTGHFTQVVWRGTTQVGCGSAQCGGMTTWVCNYDPPGNWEGAYAANVPPPC
ncbi:MAG: CAP domain-containing protein [Kofleriaceae bacterium]